MTASIQTSAATLGRRQYLHRLVQALQRVAERTRQRRALAMLDDHQLRDIGLTRRDATREAAKPFWQL